MWATFAIIAVTILCYAVEKWPIEAVALASLGAFLLLFSVVAPGGGPEPGALVAGFANPALVTVLALLIVGQALFNTDALDAPAQWLADAVGGRSTRTLTVLLVVAAVISAFINNTPVVVMFIPIMTTLARQRGFDAAKGLMPLSFASILGGMTTLIGSSTNLLVAGVAVKEGIDIGFFDITALGTILAAVGLIYVVFALPRVLRRRAGMAEEIRLTTGKQFVTQIEITAGHPLEGAQARGGMFRELTEMTVRAVLRDDIPILPPFEDITLRPRDVLIVAATRSALTRALSKGSTGMPAAEKADGDEERPIEADFTLAEVVVAPGSRYAARTIHGAGIRVNDGVVVLGVQRKSHMQRTSLAQMRLEPGDTILVGGQPGDVARLRSSRDLLLLEWSTAQVPMRRYAKRALAVFAAVVLVAATGTLPIMVAALLGALAMIMTGCINIRQASRAFDSRIFMLVGASIAAATALEATGGATYLAHAAVKALDGQPVAVLLSTFFLVVAILSNALSHHATAVLFTPVAIGIAQTIGADPFPFVVAVIFAANCSFATPIGYQTNLLVMGPGHYRFADYLTAGTPLVILIWLTYSFAAPWYYAL
ncbi:MAG: SLC13 family permease [Salaquimonas sp.]|nr:SLC13 family permease [Salaquimonas sp.]